MSVRYDCFETKLSLHPHTDTPVFLVLWLKLPQRLVMPKDLYNAVGSGR